MTRRALRILWRRLTFAHRRCLRRIARLEAELGIGQVDVAAKYRTMQRELWIDDAGFFGLNAALDDLRAIAAPTPPPATPKPYDQWLNDRLSAVRYTGSPGQMWDEYRDYLAEWADPAEQWIVDRLDFTADRARPEVVLSELSDSTG